MKSKILIVEDDPIIAMETTAYLEDMNFEPVGPAYDAETAMELLKSTKLTAVLLDIDLGGELSGMDVARFINQNYRLPFIYITSFSDRSTLAEVKTTFPAGYLVKPFREQDLRTTLEIALFNHQNQAPSPKLSLELVNRHSPESITQREFDTLQLLREGLSNKEIAAQLYISTNTLKTHLKRLYAKLDVQSRTELLAKIREWL